jgi:hypothetical protein
MALTHVSNIISKKFGKNSLYVLIKNWRQITGETIFKISAPVKIKDKTLIVAVKNNVWLQELSFFKTKLLGALHKYTPEIKEVLFILSSEFNKKTDKPKNKPKDKPGLNTLTSTDTKFISSILEKIEDKELKGIFENIIKIKLTNKKIN